MPTYRLHSIVHKIQKTTILIGMVLIFTFFGVRGEEGNSIVCTLFIEQVPISCKTPTSQF